MRPRPSSLSSRPSPRPSTHLSTTRRSIAENEQRIAALVDKLKGGNELGDADIAGFFGADVLQGAPPASQPEVRG